MCWIDAPVIPCRTRQTAHGHKLPTHAMWTAAERTFIQSLLKRDIPLHIIVKILLKNREGGLNKWKHVKMMINIIGYLSYLVTQVKVYGPDGQHRFTFWYGQDEMWYYMMDLLGDHLWLGHN